MAFSPLREELRRAFRELRGADLSPARGAAAIALGLFIGSLPIFGFHLPIVLGLCLWLRLDAAVMYVAANISNPFFLPFLLTSEVQVGAYLRTGAFLHLEHELTRAAAAEFTGDLFLGAVVVGLGLAAAGAAITWASLAIKRWIAPSRAPSPRYRLPTTRPRGSTPSSASPAATPRPTAPPPPSAAAFTTCAASSSATPSPGSSPTSRATAPARSARSPTSAQGAASSPSSCSSSGAPPRPGAWTGTLPRSPPPSRPPRLLARTAPRSRSTSTPVTRARPPPAADTVLLIDLIHYFKIEEQDSILRRAAAAVRPGGRLLVREADTERGLRSVATLLEELVFTALRFNRGERVRLRPAREIVAQLEEAGLSCEVRPAWGKTPFSNVLAIGTRPLEACSAGVKGDSVAG